MNTSRVALFGLLFVSACDRAPAAGPPPTTASAIADPAVDMRLAIAGRQNETAAIASHGSTIVITWTAAAAGGADVFAVVSQDAGATWTAPHQVNDVNGETRISGEQPPRVAIGASIRVMWTAVHAGVSSINTAESVDGGKTFAPARLAHAAGLSGARGWGSIAADDNGGMHLLWLDGRFADGHAAAHTHSHADMGSAPHPMQHAQDASPRQDIVMASLGPGATPIEAHVAANVCFCCKTAVATGPRGAVFAAWRHIFGDNLRDIAFAASADNGRTFGPLIRVSEDNWHLDGCPDDGPAMAVDAGGTIHMVWPTVIQGAKPTKALFYAFSRDGRSFSPRARIDDPAASQASHPQIAPDEAGGVVVVWDDYLAKQRRVRLRHVAHGDSTAGTPPQILDAVIVSGQSPAMYPAVTSAKGRTIVAWTSSAKDTSAIQVKSIR